MTALLSTPSALSRAGPVVHFPSGDARGAVVNGLHTLRGIPYALPPVGDRRWRPPLKMARREGVLDARRSGSACTQPTRRSGSIYANPMPATDEDCLYLDIWAPEHAHGLPVFVWIHGGSFIWGGGSEALYDGAALAQRGAVVVSINYRLGIFGYLAHPQLSAESSDGVSGNYGLLDQIAALEWVKENIAAVGGDPGNLTIAGESAGALSVLYLMAAPAARGLFARAIAQSAYMISTPALRQERCGHEPAEDTGARLCQELGADGLAAMRAMDAQNLADGALRLGFAPAGTVDGHVLPDQLVDVFEQGKQSPVPLLAGFNSGEVRSLPFLVPPLPATGEAYETAIRARYGELTDQFLSLYPPHNIRESALACVRDALYGWTALKLAETQNSAKLPFFLYYFDHTYPSASAAGLDGFHGCELPYLFATTERVPPLWPPVPPTQRELALCRAIGDYWISFARNGMPRAHDAPDWHEHMPTRAYMHFSGTPRVSHDLLPGMFAFHEEVALRRRAADNQSWNWNVGVAAPSSLPGAAGR